VAERSFKRQGVDVTIREDGENVELELNGHPVPVAVTKGQYTSQFAHMFRRFDSVEEIVDTLLSNEGKTWTLKEGGTPMDPHGGHGGHGGHGHGGHG
jgi:hypothetical protein